MRFVFFGFGSRERALELIDEQILSYEAQLATRRQNQKKWQSKDVYVNQVADLGIEMNLMFLNWLKTARKKISEQDS